MTPDSTPDATLGWSAFFEDQLTPDDAPLARFRIAKVHRARLTAFSPKGEVKLTLPPHITTADFAVGDWVLGTSEDNMVTRRLDRHSVVQRSTVGGRAPQLIAANLDTLFIVTSCNDDFNVARLERYLALANEAGTTPVIVLTKADETDNSATFKAKAEALQRGQIAVPLNAKSQDAVTALSQWCGAGQTVALIGSSGVGKSTLLNTLAASNTQLTGGIREDDARGRHTTTGRSLHAIQGGGWAIDTPGMRTLHVSDLGAGLDLLFAEITDLAPNCRFRDCTHGHEPGCAVQAAVKAGDLDAARVDRWRKLDAENRANAGPSAGPQARQKPQARTKRRRTGK